MTPETALDGSTESPLPKTRKTPSPTYAPFILAAGVTMIFWGLATSPVMSAAGFIALVWALWTWIAEIASDWRS